MILAHFLFVGNLNNIIIVIIFFSFSAISVPPFKVTECGYAGFTLPIEIYFKNKQPPRKISFEYDLFLNGLDAPAISFTRHEKLNFTNPTPEFKTKLIKAGGVRFFKIFI